MPDAIKTMTKLNRALVKIETSGGPDKPCRNEGSGFIVSAGDRKVVIVTANHVVSMMQPVPARWTSWAG